MFEGSLAKKVRPIDSRRASTAGPASGIPGAGRASPQTGMVSSRSVSDLMGYSRDRVAPPPWPPHRPHVGLSHPLQSPFRRCRNPRFPREARYARSPAHWGKASPREGRLREWQDQIGEEAFDAETNERTTNASTEA